MRISSHRVVVSLVDMGRGYGVANKIHKQANVFLMQDSPSVSHGWAIVQR